MDARGRLTNEHKVFALEPPPTTVMSLKDSSSRTMSHIHIVPEANTKIERKGGFGLKNEHQNAQILDEGSDDDEWNGDAQKMDKGR